MGVYLSTPVTDKVSSDNKCKSFTYGESSMQGWRQTQEDAHNCSPDFDPNTDTSLFAVYDGHGGAEVAQYCAVHLPAFIRETEAYKSGNLIGALEDAFLGFDELLTREDVMKELKILAGVEDLYDNNTNAEEVAASRAEAELLAKEAKMPLNELLTNYDRQPMNIDIGSGEGSSSNTSTSTHMIEAGGDCGSSTSSGFGTSLPPHIRSFVGKQNWQEFLSPLLKAKKFESDPNSNDTRCLKDDSNSVSSAGISSDVKPAASGSSVEVSDSGENKSRGENSAFANVKMSLDSKLANGHADNENNMNTEKEHSIRQSLIINNNNKNEPNSDESSVQELDSSCYKSVPDCDKSSDSLVSSSVSCPNNMNTSVGNKPKTDVSVTSEAESTTNQSLSGPESSTASGETSMPSSTTGSNRPASSSISPAPVSSQTSTASSSSSPSVVTAGSTSVATATNTQEQEAGCSSSSDKRNKEKGSVFHPESSEDDDDDEEDYEESEDDDDDDDDDEEGDEEELMDDSEDDEVDEMDDKTEPIREMEEPGVDSGCTAVVVLVRGSQILVANAGDSRCILSRDGKAVELSFDHKPEDDPERSRIEAAGGTVTSDGRVNGGLNLSRAIGDHFYKRNHALPPKEQMITAHPDIQTGMLGDDDEFIVLACDGIWNFMTSQEVVDFVKVRLSDPEKRESPSKICEEMFDYCLAPNTMGDGTGCDNMTCIIVLLDRARKGLINTQKILDISTSATKQLEPHAVETIVDNIAAAFSAASESSAASDDGVSTIAMDDVTGSSSAVSKRAVSDVESSSDVDSSSVHPEKRPKLDVSDDSEAETKEAATSSDT